MSARLATRIEVSALIRRIEGEGGHGMILAKGDPEAGTILLILADRGVVKMGLERILDVTDAYRWRPIAAQYIEDSQSLNLYIQRRRGFDSDLWVVELDIAGVERFGAEMIATG